MNLSKDEMLNELNAFNHADLLDSLKNYKDEMTVSQVVRFFGRRGITLTKTMLQNYIRVGVLSPLFEKRYYLKHHLLQIFLINQLKSLYSLDELSRIFLLLNEDAYKTFIEISENFAEKISGDTKQLFKNAGENNLAAVTLALMLNSAMTKKLALALNQTEIENPRV